MIDETGAGTADVRPVKQEKERASGEITQVAPGILRLQLPIDLPGLGHVNTYAIEDARGFALVDPGLPGRQSWEALNDRLARAGIPLRRVHTVVVTHSHPDHFGGAGLLAEETGARVVASDRFRTMWDPQETWQDEELDSAPAGERPDAEPHLERLVRSMSGETHDDDGRPLPPSPFGRPTPWGGAPAGMPPERVAQLRQNLSDWLTWFRLPRPTLRLADDEVVALGGREWFGLFTPGHTDDHLCLWDPTEGVLLSGDHVLPTITPHISGLGEDADPLARYLDSLARVAVLPGVTTVLPAHGHPFDDVARRVDEITAHHQDRLQRLHEISGRLGWTSIQALSQEMFHPRSWGSMAESETYAHVEHLRHRGEARRREARQGGLEYLVG